MTDRLPERSAIVPTLVLLAAMAAVFYPVLAFDFVTFDDGEHVARNADFLPPTITAVARYWTSPFFGMYVPVTYTVWASVAAVAFDHTTRTLDPRAFHVVNLVVHVLAGLGVMTLLLRLVKSRWAAAAGAAVFAIHPLQVETVAWVSSLRDVLAGMFGVLALCIHCQAWRKNPEHRKSQSWIAELLSLACFALAMLSKPTAVVVPLMALAIDIGWLGIGWKRVLRSIGPWFVLAAAGVVAARSIQPSTDIFRPPIWFRPVVAIDAIGFYLCKLLWPVRLGVDYGRSPDWLLAHPAAALPAAAIVVAVGILILLSRFSKRTVPPVPAPAVLAANPPVRAPASQPLVVAAIFVAALLPVLGLVTFDFQYFSTVADRYVYLAMLAPALGVAAAVARLTASRFRRPLKAIVLAGLFALVGLSSHQVRTWRNTDTLCQQALAVNPDSLIARNLLATDAGRQGDTATAIQLYLAEFRVKPDDPIIHFHLGNALVKSGQWSAALAEYRAAMRTRPNDPTIHIICSGVLARMGDDAGARHELQEAIRVAPSFAPAHRDYGIFLLNHHEIGAARRQFQEALRLDPQDATAREGLRKTE